MIYRLSEIFQKISKKISVCNLTKRSTLPLLFFGEILKNGWHSLSGRFPRKHSQWNHFSIIATLNSHYVYLKKDYHQEIFENGWLLTSSYATRNVDCIPRIKIKHTFSKTLSSHLQSVNGMSQILLFETLKVWVFSKAISSRPTPRYFLIVTTKKELD